MLRLVSFDKNVYLSIRYPKPVIQSFSHSRKFPPMSSPNKEATTVFYLSLTDWSNLLLSCM